MEGSIHATFRGRALSHSTTCVTNILRFDTATIRRHHGKSKASVHSGALAFLISQPMHHQLKRLDPLFHLSVFIRQ